MTRSRIPATLERLRHCERGSSAVEFAIVFPVFFLIFYAIVTYGVIFAAQQSLTLIAEESARTSLKYVAMPAGTTPDAAIAKRASAACNYANSATALLHWSSTVAQCVATPAACTYDSSMRCIQVVMTYNYASNPLVPSLPLLDLTTPPTLSAQAMVQLNPENVL